MFRTTRTARRGRAALTWMGEWRLPGPERRAARAERATLHRMRLERDNTLHTPWARAAALEAERAALGRLRHVDVAPWHDRARALEAAPATSRHTPSATVGPAHEQPGRAHDPAHRRSRRIRAGRRWSDEPMLFGWLRGRRGGPRRGVPDAAVRAAARRRAGGRDRGSGRRAAGRGRDVPGVNGDVEGVERFAVGLDGGDRRARHDHARARPLRARHAPAPGAAARGRRPRRRRTRTSTSRCGCTRRFQAETPSPSTDVAAAGARADGRPAAVAVGGRVRRARLPRRAARRRWPASRGSPRLHAAGAPPPRLRRRGHGRLHRRRARPRRRARRPLHRPRRPLAPTRCTSGSGFRPIGGRRVVAAVGGARLVRCALPERRRRPRPSAPSARRGGRARRRR